MFPLCFDSCPSCRANASAFVEANILFTTPENVFKEILCTSCNQPCEHHKKICPNCNADPLAIKCECGDHLLVGFGQDSCTKCGKNGFYDRQIMSLGFSPNDLSKLVLCGNCRNAYGRGHKQCPFCRVRMVLKRGLFWGEFDSNESQGMIYILINPSMPNLVKIGKTTRASEERATELSGTTGVPSKFIVAYEVSVSNCDAAESEIHNRLSDFRVNENREFFNIPLKASIKLVEEITLPYQGDE